MLPGVDAGLEVSMVLDGNELSEAVAKRVVDFELSAIGPDVKLLSVAPLNANIDFDPSTAPPNTEAGLDVSAELPNANVGFEPSAERPKTEGGFELSVLPPNIDIGLEPSAEAPNVNVGLLSVELPPIIGTDLAPPNKGAGLDPSADLELELVPPNGKTGALPEAGAPAGVEENVLLKVVVLANASVGLVDGDVETSPSTATGFPKRFVAEAQGELDVEFPKVDVVPNGEGLAGSFEPAAVPKTDTGVADFFDSSATGSADAEAPSVAPDGV